MMESLKQRIIEKMLFFQLKNLEKKLYKLHQQLNDYYSPKVKEKAKNSLRTNLVKLKHLNTKITAKNLPALKKYPHAGEEAGYSSVFIYAAECGYLEMIKFLLLQGGVDIHAKNPYATLFGFTLGNPCGSMALISAAKNGHFEIVKFLLEAGVEMEIEIKPLDGCEYGYDPDICATIALVEAIENNHFEIVEFIVGKIANYSKLPAKISEIACNNKRMQPWVNKKAAIACLTMQQGKRDGESNVSILPQEILNHIYSFTFPFDQDAQQRKQFLKNISTYSMCLFKPHSVLTHEKTETAKPYHSAGCILYKLKLN